MLRRRLQQLRQGAAGFVERHRTGLLRRGAILIYHRVAEPAADPWGMAISPANFAEHLAVIRRFGTPHTMTDFADHLEAQGAPDCSIAVTLDDGYADNFHCALPLLADAQVPATVYVIADAIGDPAAFWWDRLSEIFLATQTLPGTPCPVVSSGPAPGAERAFGDEATVSAMVLAANRRWSADDEPPQNRRQRMFLTVWQHFASLPVQERDDALAELCAWAGVGVAPPDALAAPMTLAELAHLAASPLVEIGGHTATHADLSALPEDLAIEEIGGGRQRLVELTGQKVSSFAYPFGRVGSGTARLLRDAGFANATCSRFGIATSRSDRFELPRLHVRNCSGKALERMLATTLGRPNGASAVSG